MDSSTEQEGCGV